VIAHRLVVDAEVLMEDVSEEDVHRRIMEECLARAPRPEPGWDANGAAPRR
jgi:hypothetical protein